ncbi:MAG TPA: endolytic transglycosylase MltG [Candidatus Kapabacteria bacterium]|nr:endolytic transglycosylase MltG [Candidatus Kapabacteria bacterium]
MRIRTIFLIVFFLAVISIYFIFFLKNKKISARDEIVAIPRGMTVSQLADSLDVHHLLRSKWTFQIAARVLDAAKDLHAGLYRITPGLSNMEVVRRLTGSEYSLILQATFPEGITMYHAASIAKEKLGLDSGIFMRFATDTAFIHGLGIPQEAQSAEGYLFPDTYEFLLSADPKGLITRMIKRWKHIVADSLYARSDEDEYSMPEIMTLASIVEAEARVPQERDTIAGVYFNRLHIGMKLDADPTVQYGLHLTRPITHDDLEQPTAYNTYLNKGLPPGPICNPGAASIRAALYPAKHPFLYFVARRDGSGGHFFSRTLSEQERMINIARSNAEIAGP